MSVRRLLPHLLALVLGVAAALLAACGQSTPAGIPSADAGELRSQLDDVRDRVEGGRCSDLNGQLRQVDEGVDALPESKVDPQLVARLREAADRLRALAPRDCSETREANRAATTTTTTETTETTPTTATTTETTATLPTETQTLPEATVPTATVPVPTTPTPPAPLPEPVPPAPEPTPPPAGTPGGGAQPELP